MPVGAVAEALAAPVPEDVRRERVVEALVGLGYPVKQAGEAVDAVVAAPAAGPSSDPVADLDVPATLRAALRHLSGR